jgi:hypothetical protein
MSLHCVRKSRVLPVLILLLGMFLPATLVADNKKSRKVHPLTRKGAASELPVVKKVTGKTVTVGKKTYEISDTTRITVNGKSATVSDLRPGMQASVAGGVLRYGKTKADTVYKATRIVAKEDNKLEEKRREYNKKQEQRARELNRRYRQNQSRR